MSDSLSQQIKRANYRAYVWRNALEPMQQLPPPESHGWYTEDEVLQPVLIDQRTSAKNSPGADNLPVQKIYVSHELFLFQYRPSMYRVLFLHGRWRSLQKSSSHTAAL